jgi:hypothetical protein
MDPPETVVDFRLGLVLLDRLLEARRVGEPIDHVDGDLELVLVLARRAPGQLHHALADARHALVEKRKQAVGLGGDLADLVIGALLHASLEVTLERALHGFLHGLGRVADRTDEAPHRENGKQREQRHGQHDAGHRDQRLALQLGERQLDGDRAQHRGFGHVVALQAVGAPARGRRERNGAAENRLTFLAAQDVARLAVGQHEPLGLIGRHLALHAFAELLIDVRGADDPGGAQPLHLHQPLEELFALVDDAVDHRFGQVHPHHLGRGAHVRGRRGDRVAAEGVQRDHHQHHQDAQRDTGEEHGHLAIQVHWSSRGTRRARR